MCGIAGFVTGPDFNTRSESIDLLIGMTRAIKHRGPDSDGVWCDAQGIGLAHTRLAILELTSFGSQPMKSASGRFVISFNGEIYNHRLLRRELEQATPLISTWKGGSDTETLLALFERYGIDKTLHNLVGMFAFAVWDNHLKCLTLVRDRFGEKPLYYTELHSRGVKSLYFGSDISVFRRIPGIKLEINRAAVHELVSYGYIIAPHTIYSNVQMLRPGHMLRFFQDKRKPQTECWWSPTEASQDALSARTQMDERDHIAKIESTLRTSIERQLQADVPVGVLLSGGIDSSLVAALAQSMRDTRIKTFSIGFSESAYDESSRARAISSHLGTDHEEFRVSENNLVDYVAGIPSAFSEPFADASQIPTILVCKIAKRSVSVALSGDGADEIFGGYSRYLLYARLYEILVTMGNVPRGGIASALGGLGCFLQNMQPFGHSLDKLCQQLLKASNSIKGIGTDGFYQRILGYDGVVDSMLLPDMSCKLTETLRYHDHYASIVQRLMISDTDNYLSNDVLTKVDRAAMSVGLETRAPFLDHALFKSAWALPERLKIRGNQGKIVLRRILSRYLPADLIAKPKSGFSVPLHSWLTGPLRGWADELLKPSRLDVEGYFDSHRISRLWRDQLAGRSRNEYRIWSVLMFQSWLESQRRM